jgi:APA family basic amino acid/polyamine antiporter
MMPRSGGEYHLLREAYHPLVGFLSGWVSLTAGFAAPIAVAAMAFGRYVRVFGEVQLDETAATLLEQNLATGLVLVISLISLGSVPWLGRFLTLFTIVKVLLIVAFVVGAVTFGGGTHNAFTFKPGDSQLFWKPEYAVSLVWVMYGYEGWNSAAYVAGEVENPQRNLPRALLYGSLIVTVLYIAVNAVFLWRAPWPAMSGNLEAALISATEIFGSTGGRFMGLLIALGLISTMAGMVWAGSRVNQRMGEDVPMLRCLAWRNASGAPWVAVLLQAALSIAFIHTGSFSQVVRYVECLLLMSSCLAVLGVIWLRISKPDAPRPFRVPFYPLTPLLFASVTLYMIFYLAQQHLHDFLWGLTTLGVGLAIYSLSMLPSRSR